MQARDGRTDRRTDRVRRNMRPPYGGGPHNNTTDRLALLLKMSHKLRLAICKRANASSSQLHSRLPSSNDFNHRPGVAMSITVSISAVQTHAPGVDAGDMSNSRRSPSLILVSVGVDHPCCQKPHGSLRIFSVIVTIFLSIPSHLARIQSSRSQYFTNHFLCGYYLNFLLKACFKSLQAHQTSR